MRRALLLLSALAAVPLVLAASTRVRVAYVPEPGFCERKPDGSYAGATLDYLAPLAKLCDWTVEPVYCTYDEALDRLARGELDLVGGLADTMDNRDRFRLSSYAIGTCGYHLFVRANSPCSPGHFASWQGLEIAVGPRTRIRRRLENFLKTRGIAYRLRTFARANEAVQAFHSGQVAAVLALGTADMTAAKILFSFPVRPSHFCVPKGREDLARQLDNAILRLLSEQPEIERLVRQRHFPVKPRLDLDLTPEERDYLAARRAANRPVRIDLTPAVPPFKGWDRTADRPQGLVCHILDEIGRRTGLTFSYIRPDDEASARSRFLCQKTEFWAPLGVSVDDLPGYADGICLASLPQVFLTRHGTQLGPLATVRFGVPSWDSRWQADYRSAGISNLVSFAFLRDTLDALLDGRIDAVAATLPQAIMTCHNENVFRRIKFSSPDTRLPHVQRIMLVPAADVDAPLVSIVAKCVSTLSTSEISAFTYHAMTESLSHAVFSDSQWILIVSGVLLAGLLSLALTLTVFHVRLSRALKLARAGERARTQFLATMSHEIRTPLNAVIGFAEFLERPSLTPEEVRSFARGVRQSSRVLLDLINDVLDLSKTEAGQTDMRQGVTDFLAFKREFLTIFAGKVRERGLRFVFGLPDDVPCLNLTPTYMRQILLNLIANAVKFTIKGGITCTVRLTPTHWPGHVDLEVSVADTGIGISPEKLETIFDPFVQDIATRGGHVYEGTGLGLPIVKRLAEAAGGTVTVTSTPGVGTTFDVRIPNVKVAPRAAKPSDTPTPPPSGDVLPQSALLVDDVPLNLMILKRHLANLGVRNVRTAASGAEALRLLADEPAALVLTDLWMPEMDGATLARRIRSEPSWKNTRLVAVTADAASEGTFDTSVFDAVLTKPVTMDKLKVIFTPPPRKKSQKNPESRTGLGRWRLPRWPC